jgi:hypothetical protein
MLETLSLGSFSGLVEASFCLATGAGEPLNVRLVEAVSLGAPRAPGAREPFSLAFLGPPDPVLPQSIYTLECDALGSIELFLVPIGRSADGVTYEAIFT